MLPTSCTPTCRPRRMSGESYTRWRSNPDEDEDEDIPEAGGGHRGAGAVTIITSSRSRPSKPLSPAGQARLVCILVLLLLVCLVCVGVGVCVGLAWGYSRNIIHHAIDHVIPAPSSNHIRASSRLIPNLQSNIIQDYARKLSQMPKKLLASYVESVWQAQGLHTTNTTFRVQLSKPDVDRPNTVQVTYSDGRQEIINSLPQELDPIPFSAYSPAGRVTGGLVYAHYGRRNDLVTLQAQKVTLEDAIFLVRHGKIHNGAKIHNAEQAGAGGVILYPDPADMRDGQGNRAPYPNGTGLPDDGIIWDTLSTFPGDPATPFLPSLEYIYRSGRSSQPLPRIPVHTISWRDAQRMLALLGGPEVPQEWRGKGQQLGYRLGGSWTPESDVINLTLTVNNIIYQDTITNIHATLPAADDSKMVMVGCHYGSLQSDPGAGLGSLLALSDALAKTFLPEGTQRKLVFSAWAASHHGIVGSTEFTQLYSWWLDTGMMAYLSIDEMLQGIGTMRVMASPALRQAIREAASHVSWPLGEAVSVRDGWRLSDPLGESNVHFSSLGSGSDFASFTAQRGIPSAHFMVMGENWKKTYSLQHSQYDTFQAYNQLLDPGFKWTHMLTSLVGVTTLVLSESDLPPVILNELSGELYNGWQQFLDLHSSALHKSGYNFTSIVGAIEKELITLNNMLTELDRWYHTRPYYMHPYPQPFPGPAHFRQVEQRLRWLTNLERGLLGPRGVGRTFTTHLMIGADPEDPYRAIHYPHAVQAITHALLQETPWESVHQELSYILAALTSYRQLFPTNLPAESQDEATGSTEPQV
ncbi:hypothetical protein OTU49_005688 [Cherax quadricarinatus]|uniref:Uncharacterized protein n=1 Tax=Cherax quadricarinatus TaxID=27406 RepID=A0AAW0WS62_CHEQU